ncbi:hypothetical protein MX569_13465 [Anoxybacillus kestanbolensis]|nr:MULTISPECIES: hypothetical protein [Anoxybacillus]MCG6184268.1 hypothetical protein [Anoxybacillus sp. LAT_26]MCG6198591.1 hypothetical protein [Anoxybacillus sp. LAT_38]MCL9971566.1 hypothetical protein [Anoxybacillus kestanbolensis]
MRYIVCMGPGMYYFPPRVLTEEEKKKREKARAEFQERLEEAKRRLREEG